MNTQQKVVGIVFLVVIIAIICFLLWYKEVIKFSSPVLAAPAYFSNDENFESALQSENIEEELLLEPVQSTETTFKPYKSVSNYKILSLRNSQNLSYGGDQSSEPSNTNLSLYNVKTQSYITGLGDPIRGDLHIEPRQSDMYKTKYTQQDARVGALTSIS